MIRVTALDGHHRWLNADLIIGVESTPDTRVALIGGQRIIVRETPEQVRDLIAGFRGLVAAGAGSLVSDDALYERIRDIVSAAAADAAAAAVAAAAAQEADAS